MTPGSEHGFDVAATNGAEISETLTAHSLRLRPSVIRFVPLSTVLFTTFAVPFVFLLTTNDADALIALASVVAASATLSGLVCLWTYHLASVELPRTITVRSGAINVQTKLRNDTVGFVSWFVGPASWDSGLGSLLGQEDALIVESLIGRFACGLADQNAPHWEKFLASTDVPRRMPPRVCRTFCHRMLIGLGIAAIVASGLAVCHCGTAHPRGMLLSGLLLGAYVAAKELFGMHSRNRLRVDLHHYHLCDAVVFSHIGGLLVGSLVHPIQTVIGFLAYAIVGWLISKWLHSTEAAP